MPLATTIGVFLLLQMIQLILTMKMLFLAHTDRDKVEEKMAEHVDKAGQGAAFLAQGVKGAGVRVQQIAGRKKDAGGGGGEGGAAEADGDKPAVTWADEPDVSVPGAGDSEGGLLFRAIADYEPGPPDEGDEPDLEFKAGQIIHVTERDDGGWWVGWREGAPDVVGQFPSNFVEPAEAGQQAGGRDREMSMQSVGSDEPLTPRATTGP